MKTELVSLSIPAGAAVLSVALLGHWLMVPSQLVPLERRVPVTQPAGASLLPVVDFKGFFEAGPGKPEAVAAHPNPVPPASWPQFRGPKLDNISTEPVKLTRNWKSPPPRVWQVTAGEGYAGPAIVDGSLYFLDYDEKAEADVLRCLSAADGQEIWRRGYKIEIGRNHGISRTVCGVADGVVVSIGPMCHVMALDAKNGDFKWGIDLCREYGTTTPDWYAGQNVLLDDGKAILAPGGSALLMAVELKTGKVAWKTPNPKHWDMTHSSVVPVMFGERKMYIYCASKGVVGVWATDGKPAFEFTGWRVSMANVPTPVPVSDNRLFLCGGYGAGSMMIQLVDAGGMVAVKPLYSLPPEVFGSEQQTPVFYKGHLYGVIPVRAELVCLGLDGTTKWASGGKYKFGAGPYMMADGCMLLLNDTGTLTMVDLDSESFKPIGQAKILDHGHDAWGPLAIVQGRLFARDMTRLACFDLREKGDAK